MSKKAKPPTPRPLDEHQAFKSLLSKIARVPKAEVDELERVYQEENERAAAKAKKGA